MSVLKDFPELILTELSLQSKEEIFDNAGGWHEEWTEILKFDGILDLISPYDGKYTETQKIIEDSTHILICEDVLIEEQQRVVFDGKVYHVTFVDNPLGMDSHKEVYLKFEGDTDEV